MDAPQKLVRLHFNLMGASNVVNPWRMLLSKELGRPVTDKEVAAYFGGYGEWRGLVYNFYPWKPDLF